MLTRKEAQLIITALRQWQMEGDDPEKYTALFDEEVGRMGADTMSDDEIDTLVSRIEMRGEL